MDTAHKIFYMLIYNLNLWPFHMSHPKVGIVYFSIYTVILFTFMADLNKMYCPSYSRYNKYIIPKSTIQSKIWEADAFISEEKNPTPYFSTKRCIKIYLRNVFKII